MTAQALLVDLGRLGIRLELMGERLRYSPQAAMTPALLARAKAHKGELLAILGQPAGLTGNDSGGDPRASGVFQPVDWPADCIDPDELEPCPKCGRLELWQTLADNWRYLRCDPPTAARKLRELVRQIRLKTTDKNGAGHNGQHRIK